MSKHQFKTMHALPSVEFSRPPLHQCRQIWFHLKKLPAIKAGILSTFLGSHLYHTNWTGLQADNTHDWASHSVKAGDVPQGIQYKLVPHLQSSLGSRVISYTEPSRVKSMQKNIRICLEEWWKILVNGLLKKDNTRMLVNSFDSGNAYNMVI